MDYVTWNRCSRPTVPSDSRKIFVESADVGPLLASSRFAHAVFAREFQATPTLPPAPSRRAAVEFLSFQEPATRLPTLVTKTNGMYLFHSTPASGFLLSPLCIALVKHFFLFRRRSSPRSFFSSLAPSLPLSPLFTPLLPARSSVPSYIFFFFASFVLPPRSYSTFLRLAF